MPATLPPADPQRDRDGHGLLVVEQERRQLCARTELVAAGDAGRCVHGIAQAPQAVDIATHGPPPDFEPLGELRTVQVRRDCSSESSLSRRVDV